MYSPFPSKRKIARIGPVSKSPSVRSGKTSNVGSADSSPTRVKLTTFKKLFSQHKLFISCATKIVRRKMSEKIVNEKSQAKFVLQKNLSKLVRLPTSSSSIFECHGACLYNKSNYPILYINSWVVNEQECLNVKTKTRSTNVFLHHFFI
jgi:hypothetical protein